MTRFRLQGEEGLAHPTARTEQNVTEVTWDSHYGRFAPGLAPGYSAI